MGKTRDKYNKMLFKYFLILLVIFFAVQVVIGIVSFNVQNKLSLDTDAEYRALWNSMDAEVSAVIWLGVIMLIAKMTFIALFFRCVPAILTRIFWKKIPLNRNASYALAVIYVLVIGSIFIIPIFHWLYPNTDEFGKIGGSLISVWFCSYVFRSPDWEFQRMFKKSDYNYDPDGTADAGYVPAADDGAVESVGVPAVDEAAAGETVIQKPAFIHKLKDKLEFKKLLREYEDIKKKMSEIPVKRVNELHSNGRMSDEQYRAIAIRYKKLKARRIEIEDELVSRGRFE